MRSWLSGITARMIAFSEVSDQYTNCRVGSTSKACTRRLAITASLYRVLAVFGMYRRTSWPRANKITVLEPAEKNMIHF